MAEKKELKKVDGQQLAMVWTPGEGFEDFSEEERAYPRIAIAQAMSGVVASGKVKLGHWYNTLTEDDLGEELTFAVIKAFHQRIYLSQEEGLVCRSLDSKVSVDGMPCATCPHSKWSEEKDAKGTSKRMPPACALVYSYVIVLKQGDGVDPVPYLLSLMRTGARAGRKLNQALQYLVTRGEPIFARWIVARTKQETKGKNSYFVPEIVLNGKVDEQLLEGFRAMRRAIMNLRVDVDVNQEEIADTQEPF